MFLLEISKFPLICTDNERRGQKTVYNFHLEVGCHTLCGLVHASAQFRRLRWTDLMLAPKDGHSQGSIPSQ